MLLGGQDREILTIHIKKECILLYSAFNLCMSWWTQNLLNPFCRDLTAFYIKKANKRKVGYTQTSFPSCQWSKTPADRWSNYTATSPGGLKRQNKNQRKTQRNTCYSPCIMDNKHKGNIYTSLTGRIWHSPPEGSQRTPCSGPSACWQISQQTRHPLKGSSLPWDCK